MKFLVATLVLISTSLAFAKEDLPKGKYAGYDYHWDAHKNIGTCMNKAHKGGLNPHYLGTCGDLRGLDLSDADLSGLDLSGSYLDGVNLEGAKLNGTKLISIKARGTNFTKAHMNGADLTSSILAGALFNSAQLNGANFNQASLSGAKIKEAEVSGTNFERSNLRGCFLESNLKTVVTKNASYSIGTKFSESLTPESKKLMTNASLSASENSASDDEDPFEKSNERQPSSK